MINNLRSIGALGAVYVACAAVWHRPGGRPGRPCPSGSTALNERSEALNREYGLGDHAKRRQLGAPGPNWLVALNARSDGSNRKYGLGEYGRQGAGTASSSDGSSR